MGFLRNLFTSKPPPAVAVQLKTASFTDQRPEAELSVVGEAQHQVTLTRLAGGLRTSGPAIREQRAVIAREPNNRFDPNAIAVYLQESEAAGVEIGYLAREQAIAYQPIFDLISPATVILTSAKLIGGWARRDGGQGYIGVVLNLGTPAELAAELWADKHPPIRGHRWDGRLVAFTGESGFAVGGIQLDHLGQQFLAHKAGCTTWPRVTKKVQVCVTSDPEHETGNLAKAEQYGLELVSETDFWAGLGLNLERV